MWPFLWIAILVLGLITTIFFGAVGFIFGVIGLTGLSMGPLQDRNESSLPPTELGPPAQVPFVISREMVIRDLHGNAIGYREVIQRRERF